MIISTNWLKKFTSINQSIEDLSTLIGARLVEIESAESLGDKYSSVVIARVESVERVPDSEHLNVVLIDDGATIDTIKRDKGGYIQVVCGAPNVTPGMHVAWLPPGSVVPSTHGSSESFILDSRKLRGVMSHGMIASAKELDLYDEHTGILELDNSGVVPGASFVEALELRDTLLDIENKSLTHRPDTFGVIGFAREVAAIQGLAFETPGWMKAGIDAADAAALDVTIEDAALSDRYQALMLSNIDQAVNTPLEITTYIARCGVRPISPIVDITNYVMLETGQPLHAFDYDKLLQVNSGVIDIRVRAGRDSETLRLIDGRTILLSSQDIVIANGDTPVALAGAMGGADTEIDSATTTILLESATFNLYNLRATQMRHGIFSEAITRFTKGQPAELTAPALSRAASLVRTCMDASLTGYGESYPLQAAKEPISVDLQTINSLLGSEFTINQVVGTLTDIEFAVEVANGTDMLIKAPFWRTDIAIPEDVIEEVGRINGFDTIQPSLPLRDFTAVRPSAFDVLRSTVRRSLFGAGANEVLTYSFVHGDVLRKAHQDPRDSYKIINSISPDLQYYRQSLSPSLLGLVRSNHKAGYKEFGLFEINKVHGRSLGLTEEEVPREAQSVAFVHSSKYSNGSSGAAYYQAKTALEYVLRKVDVTCHFMPLSGVDDIAPMYQVFEQKRSAQVIDGATSRILGVVGEYKKTVTRANKLPEYCAGFELLLDEVHEGGTMSAYEYAISSRYPSTSRDICFQVKSNISYSSIIASIDASLEKFDLAANVEPVDLYQADDSADVKNVTVRITLTSYEKTLTSEEASGVVDAVISTVTERHDARVV